MFSESLLGQQRQNYYGHITIAKITTMILRFNINQAEAFRQGIDCPKSIAHVEVNPANLDQATRDLIADRLEGIDVLQLEFMNGKISKKNYRVEGEYTWRIEANAPTFEALLEAINADEKEVRGPGSRYADSQTIHNTPKASPLGAFVQSPFGARA